MSDKDEQFTASDPPQTITVLHIAATFWAIHHGYGLPLREIGVDQVGDVEKVQRPRQETFLANRIRVQALFTSQLSYVGSMGLTRISTAFFIGHLTRHSPHVRMSNILVAVSGAWTAASILIVALRSDIAHPWTTLDGEEAMVGFLQGLVALDIPEANSPQYLRWLAVEATGLAIEVALSILAIWLIWGLQMKIQKRLLTLSVFGFRLLYIPYLPLRRSRKLTQLLRLIPIVALRLLYLSPRENYKPTLTSIRPHILTELALEYALISTSITALKPFLKPFHTGAIVNTIGGGGSGLYSASRSGAQGIYMLSSGARDNKDCGQTKTTTFRSESSNNGLQPQSQLYAGNTGEHTAVSCRGGAPRDDIESVESNGSEQWIIRTTKGWAVRYEN